MSKHRSCEVFIKDVEERVEKASALLSGLEAMLTAGEINLDQSVEQLDQHLQRVKTQEKVMLADIKLTRNRLKKAVNACCQRMEKVVVTAVSEVESAMKDGKSVLLQRRGNLTSHR